MGCVIASRLTENPEVSLLVVHQGPVADTWSSLNLVFSADIFRDAGISLAWGSQPVRGVDSRYIQLFKGQVLEGSSRLNSMLYTRGGSVVWFHIYACE